MSASSRLLSLIFLISLYSLFSLCISLNSKKRYPFGALLSAIMGQDGIFENTVEVGRTELKVGGNIGDKFIYDDGLQALQYQQYMYIT